MPKTAENQDAPKNRTWMFLVGAFIVLAAIGMLTS